MGLWPEHLLVASYTATLLPHSMIAGFQEQVCRNRHKLYCLSLSYLRNHAVSLLLHFSNYYE